MSGTQTAFPGNGLDWGTILGTSDFGQMPINTGAMQSMPNVTEGPGMFGSAMGGLGDWFNNSGFMGKTLANGDKMQGWGAPVMGAVGGLASSFLGMQQLGMAKDAFNENKRQFEMNWGAQQKTVNSRLEDRQRARVAANPGAYQSPTDYMKQNGI